MPKLTNEEIHLRFEYQKPTERAKLKHGEVSEMCINMAIYLSTLPECRELSLAFTHLEEVRTWANSAIARHHEELEQEHV